MKYIYKMNDKYCIYKSVNCHQEYFGRFLTLPEAINYRDFLVEHDWNTKYKKTIYKKRRPSGSNICSKTSNQYIYKTGNKKYGISKQIKGKLVYFGTFDTIEDARQYRNFLVKHKWDKKYKLSKTQQKKLPKHIRRSREKYTIQKYIDEKYVYFGTFPDLESARKYRDFLVEHDWNTKYIKRVPRKDLPRYVHYNKTRDTYIVTKLIDNKVVRFGTYNTLEEAREERDFWESINWNLDLLDLY